MTYTNEQIAALLKNHSSDKNSGRSTDRGEWYYVTPESARFIAAAPAIVKQQADRIDELETALKEVDEALYWLLNLVHGNSKGGPDFSPPSNAEWIEAVEAGKDAHANTGCALGGDA